MGLDQLTVLIITFNEEANIRRTLDSLDWAQNVVVLDSGSSDGTLEILRKSEKVRVISRKFTDFADQCNFGLSQVETPWVLSIDADYVFPAGCATTIEQAFNQRAMAFQAEFDYCIYGQPVRGSILPPRTVLYQTKGAAYKNDGHGHRVIVEGDPHTLPFRIRHDDRKPLSRWLQSQIRYARQEAEKLIASQARELGRNDRVRKTIVLAPGLVFLLVYVFRGGFISGWRGLFYALQRFTAELLLSLFLIDARLHGAVKDHGSEKA